MNRYRIISVIIVLTSFLIACSDDSNPAAPASVGTYTGTTGNGGDVEIKIGNINGSAYVTSYSITHFLLFGSRTVGHSNSEGIVKVSNNSFTISLSEDENDFIAGTRNGNEITGTYSIYDGDVDGQPTYLTGTYVVAKN